MKIYFVRHGESEYNAKNLYQPGESKLSEKGIEQANFLAHRFKSIPVDIVFASTMGRAKHTAEIINEVAKKEIIFTDLLRELKRPSEIVGKHQDAPEVVKILEEIRSKAEDISWHHSDEENFADFKNRGKEFFSFITQRSEQNILCVTHAGFLRMIVALMLKEDMSAELYHRFWHFLRTKNTGITLCEYEDGQWRLVTWNDHAHLG